MKLILGILGLVGIYVFIYYVLGGVLNETIDVNNTAQLIRVGATFVASLALLGGYVVAAFFVAFRRS